ncbi:MAG: HAMP domain-containing histidine kinase [Bacteroidales bacterium]|nr:HAMP domain-containing histidine kinase [Bacteroidales bacterium]
MDNKQLQFCPITGMSVLQLPEWKDLHVSRYYRVSFKVVGTSILVTIPEGDSSSIDLDILYAHRQNVINIAFGKQHYVELKDFSKTRGVPDRNKRILQRDYMSSSFGACVGFIGYNTPIIIKCIFKTGLVFNKPNYPVLLVDDYANAIIKASEILAIDINAVMTSDLGSCISNPNWNYKNKNSGAEFEARLYNSVIYYSKQSGRFSEQDLDFAKEVNEDIFKNHLQNKEYFRISEYSGESSISPKVKREYVKFLIGLHEKYNSKPVCSFIIGANVLVKTAILISSYIKFNKVKFVNSIEEVKRFIMKLDSFKELVMSNVSNPENILITKSDIENLTSHIGSLTWANDEDELPINEMNQNNALSMVFEALSLVRDDIRALKLENELLRKENVVKENIHKDQIQQNNDFVYKLISKLVNDELQNDDKSEIALHNTELEYINQASILVLSEVLEKYKQTKLKLLDVLTFAEINANKFALEFKPTNINDIIDELLELFTPQIQSKQIKLIKRIMCKSTSLFYVDRKAVYKILQALLGYIIRKTTNGSIIVEFDYIAEYSLSNTLVVKVIAADCEILVTEEDNLFNPFDDNNFDTKSSQSIELNIAKKLVILLNGIITVNSKIGDGLSFTVQFFDVQHCHSKIENKEEYTPDFRKINAIILKDITRDQEFIEQLFGQVNICYEIVSGKNDFVRLLRSHEFHLVYVEKEVSMSLLMEVFDEVRKFNFEKSLKFLLCAKNHDSFFYSFPNCSLVYFEDKEYDYGSVTQLLMKHFPFDLSRQI